jgi:YD repeat-containing protein
MTSYVYNAFDEVSFITGANGLSTHYVYDAAGRLKETWVEVLDNVAAGISGGFKQVNKNSYNYKNQ